MSKRNLILLIIVLIIITATAFGFLYFYQPSNQNRNVVEEGINFFTDFLPFGKSNNMTEDEKEETKDVSGLEGNIEENIYSGKLQKISSFAVAGFTVFNKERFKEIPEVQEIVIPAESSETNSGSFIKTNETTPSAPPTEFVSSIRL